MNYWYICCFFNVPSTFRVSTLNNSNFKLLIDLHENFNSIRKSPLKENYLYKIFKFSKFPNRKGDKREMNYWDICSFINVPSTFRVSTLNNSNFKLLIDLHENFYSIGKSPLKENYLYKIFKFSKFPNRKGDKREMNYWDICSFINVPSTFRVSTLNNSNFKLLIDLHENFYSIGKSPLKENYLYKIFKFSKFPNRKGDKREMNYWDICSFINVPSTFRVSTLNNSNFKLLIDLHENFYSIGKSPLKENYLYKIFKFSKFPNRKGDKREMNYWDICSFINVPSTFRVSTLNNSNFKLLIDLHENFYSIGKSPLKENFLYKIFKFSKFPNRKGDKREMNYWYICGFFNVPSIFRVSTLNNSNFKLLIDLHDSLNSIGKSPSKENFPYKIFKFSKFPNRKGVFVF